MSSVSLLPMLWRLVLAVSLATVPLASLWPDATAAAVPASAESAPMPCHDPPAPPPGDAPCDDGCCPMPDCGPGACRLAGSMMAGGAPLLPGRARAVPRPRFSSPTMPATPSGEPLRPPIA